jgi:diaminopimelate decarboxylase
MIEADIVGPMCETADTFAKDRRIPAVNSGDYLSIMTAGAYASSMSSEYLSRPKCAEVLVRGDQFFTIRHRATLDNLLCNEEIPDFLGQPLPEKI